MIGDSATMNNMRRKGQLSFDLGFAIILALLIFAALMAYWQTSEASVQEGRVLMGLNMIADYTLGNLNAFHNSIGTSDNVSYSLDLLDEYLFSTSSDPRYGYNLSYQVTFNLPQIIFSDTHDASRRVVRELAFDIDCSAPIPALETGDVFTFKTCQISGSHIKCASCAKS